MIQEKDCKVILLGLIEIFIVTTAIRISHYNLFNLVAVKVAAKQCCLMIFFFFKLHLQSLFLCKNYFLGTIHNSSKK